MILLGLLATGPGLPAGAQAPTPGQAAPAAQPAAPEHLVLRAGTEVPLELAEQLSSKRARQGQRVGLRVTEDVVVDGRIVFPKGTPAVGEVSRVVARGMFGKSGKLRVRAMFIELAGTRIRIDGEAADRGRSGAAPVAVAAVLVGAGAGFISGTSAVLPAGSPLTGYVHHDVRLMLGAPAG